MATVRYALTNDSAAIAQLLGALGYPATVEQVRAKLNTLSLGEFDAVYVAETDHGVVGCISLHVLELFHVEGRLGRITSLVVKPSARGAGIGTQLVVAGEAYLVEKGCVRAEVTSGDHRLSAHDFYERRGYAVADSRFVKALGT